MAMYLLFGFDRYYPRGGFNDHSEVKLSDYHIWFGNFQLLDIETGERQGINIEWEIEKLYGDEDYDVTDELREKIILNFISNAVN